MKAITIAAFFFLLLSIMSCGSDPGSRSQRAMEASSGMAADTSLMESPEAGSPQSSSPDEAAISLHGPGRKIIKTADIRCRVADVYEATTRLERLIQSAGGLIADSRLENTSEESRVLPYKRDSLQKVETFTATASLTLRVPVSTLDTVLSDIAGSAAFIHTRNLHLDDVTLRYLSNKLKAEATAGNEAALRANALARRSGEAIVSGEYAENRNDTRIDRRIENMQLADQVAYATLKVDLYQPQRISRLVIPDMELLLKPTLGQQAALAWDNGMQLLRSLLIALLTIWPLLLLSIVIYALWRMRIWGISRFKGS